MLIFTPDNARVEVLTFKEGLLSPMAHDLCIDVQDFEVEISDGHVEGHFDLSSLVVIFALDKGEVDGSALSASDKKKIQKAIRNDVLHTNRYPECTFEADLNGVDEGIVVGELELHGEEGTVRANVEESDAGVSVNVDVHQPDFGIKPYTAMLGSIRIRPNVIIRVLLKDVTLEALQKA